MVCLGLLVSGASYANHDTPEKTAETYNYMSLFQRIFEIIRSEHVDPVNDKELMEAAIRGMISKLDKHSTYLDPAEFHAMIDNMSGTFYGIGAEVEKDKDTGHVGVVAPIDGSPAKAAGIKAGDLIKSINGKPLKELSLTDAVKIIRGPIGTDAVLEIIRDGKPLSITVVRGKIKQKVVRSKMLPSNIGYIRLSQFGDNAEKEVREAIASLTATLKTGKTFKGLVLDLRSNPGGLLKGAINISDMFVKSGVIVSVRGRDAEHHTEITNATPRLKFPLGIPMVILINGGSASASEIVAGTLQDLKRATILGVKSYGKGSVQHILGMPNGGALRLTRAKYYTASGKVIHGVGITPDVIFELPKEWKPETREELDPQLLKAIEVILSGKARTGNQ